MDNLKKFGNTSKNGNNKRSPSKQCGDREIPDAITRTFDDLLNTHEVKVLGMIGLFIGYICVFFVKILSFTNIYVGALGISLLTFILMMLDPRRNLGSADWWIRALAVVMLSLFLTSPQLYYAWTVSVSELANSYRDAAIMNSLSPKRAPPIVNIERDGE